MNMRGNTSEQVGRVIFSLPVMVLVAGAVTYFVADIQFDPLRNTAPGMNSTNQVDSYARAMRSWEDPFRTVDLLGRETNSLWMAMFLEEQHQRELAAGLLSASDLVFRAMEANSESYGKAHEAFQGLYQEPADTEVCLIDLGEDLRRPDDKALNFLPWQCATYDGVRSNLVVVLTYLSEGVKFASVKKDQMDKELWKLYQPAPDVPFPFPIKKAREKLFDRITQGRAVAQARESYDMSGRAFAAAQAECQKAIQLLDSRLRITSERKRLQELPFAYLTNALGGIDRDKVGVVAVVADGSPFQSGIEMRIRQRIAIKAAMRAGRLGAAERDQQRHLVMSVDQGQMPWVIPYELFVRDPYHAKNTNHTNYFPFDRIICVWVKDTDLGNRPLGRLRAILSALQSNVLAYAIQPTNAHRGEAHPFGVIGPRSSDGLRAMLAEASMQEAQHRSAGGKDDVEEPAHIDMHLYSCYATAPDSFLTVAEAKLGHSTSRGFSKKLLEHQWPGLSFINRIGTDDELCFALAAELMLRGVDVTQDTILLLSEYDTAYGRALPQVFQGVVGAIAHNLQPSGASGLRNLRNPAVLHGMLRNHGQLYQTFLQTQAGHVPESARTPANIILYSYLQGVDGSSGGAASASDPKGGKAGAYDLREGDHQLDYIRRLAYDLGLETGRQETAQVSRRVKAVGVLGTDFYDKVYLLQALRRILPNCVFFTTGIDDRLHTPNQIRWTRNVVTASSFGLAPHMKDSSAKATPFRDNYQTSAFEACLAFLRMPSDIAPFEESASVFEVGMTRFEKLNVHSSSSLQPGPSLLRQFKGMLAMPVFVWILLLWAIMLVFLMMFREAEKEPLTLKERLWRNGGFVVGVLFLSLIYFCQNLEPKELGEGVSCLGTALFFTVALGLTWMNG